MEAYGREVIYWSGKSQFLFQTGKEFKRQEVYSSADQTTFEK